MRRLLLLTALAVTLVDCAIVLAVAVDPRILRLCNCGKWACSLGLC